MIEKVNAKKVLILKNNDNDFEKFYSNNMKSEHIDVEEIYKKNKKMINKIRDIWFRRNLPKKYIWYGNWKKSLNRYDIIILFDYILEDDIIYYIRKNNPNCKFIYWNWNTISQYNKVQLNKKRYCEFWSFDKVDCQVFGMKFNEQFYFLPNKDLLNKKIKNDVFFIGIDKDRKNELIRLKNIFTRNNIKFNFKVIGKENKKICDGFEITTTSISYNEVLHQISQTRCIVDLVKSEQVGLTIRVLEAIFYSKKLITNNVNLVNYDFYDENNIFIIGIHDENRLNEFINSKFKKIEDSIKTKYLYSSWLQKFLE